MSLPIEKLKPYSHIKSYKKGANIFFQGEVPRRGAMVADGIIRSYTITSSGDERTVAFFTRHDLLPLSWLMGTTTTSLFYYEAVSDVRLLQFSHEDFQKHILSDNAALLEMFDTVTKDQTAAMLRINGLTQSRAEEKVAFTLYYILFRYGIKEPGNEFHTIKIPLRHTTIAGLVGLSRESTTKILGHLQKEGIINYENTTYTVYKEKLENHIGEDAFRDVVLQ